MRGPDPPPLPTTYILGLDLAQVKDYTALAVAEKTWRPNPAVRDRLLSHYAIRHLKRWPLKTPYTEIVREVKELVATPPLKHPALAVDQTGVGRAVVESLRASQLRAGVQPVLITAGHEITHEGGAWHVPKKELGSCLQVLLQGRRLHVAPLPDREVLVKELGNFKVKVTIAANETFEAWRERDHDDLVLAVALACWLGERGGQPHGGGGAVAPEQRPWKPGAGRASAAARRGMYGRRG